MKRLNKRFDFSEEHIKAAFANGEFKFATIEEQPHASTNKQENVLLKVKYDIHGCELKYEWNLRKQTHLEVNKYLFCCY